MTPDQRWYWVNRDTVKWRPGALLGILDARGVSIQEYRAGLQLADALLHAMVAKGRVAVENGFYLKNPRL